MVISQNQCSYHIKQDGRYCIDRPLKFRHKEHKKKGTGKKEELVEVGGCYKNAYQSIEDVGYYQKVTKDPLHNISCSFGKNPG
jgi:hypothetical protein